MGAPCFRSGHQAATALMMLVLLTVAPTGLVIAARNLHLWDAPPPPPPPPQPHGFPQPPGKRSTFAFAVVKSNTTVDTGIMGDTWPSTWASNGDSYAMGCDNTQPGHANRSFMDWWRVTRSPLSLSLLNYEPVPTLDVLRVCGKHFGNNTKQGNIKPSSVIAIGNTLYAGVQCITYYDTANASFPGRQRAWNAWIITSVDGGQTWDVGATPTDFFTGVFTNPMFIQAGMGHGDAPDGFVYVHFPAAASPPTAYWDGNELVLAGRVPTSKLLTRSAWEFWDGSGWVADERSATPVFEYPFMIGQDHTFYSTRLKRYFLPNYGFVSWETGEPASWHGYWGQHHRAPTSQLTLYEAPAPQGPWALVHVEQPWNLDGNGAYCPDFPLKWASADGLTLHMVLSACCSKPGYSFHVTEVALTLGERA